MNSTNPPLMTVPDAAKWLGISKRAAYRAVEDGTLPVIRIGSQRLLVPRPQLETLLAGRQLQLFGADAEGAGVKEAT